MPSPLSRIRVAIVGAGYIAETHLEVLRKLPFLDLVAVVDLNTEAAARLARRYQIPASYPDVATMCAEAKPDVAHVLVPPSVHEAVAGELLDLGVSVFVEKPLAVDSAGCRRLIEKAKAKDLVVGVNHNNRFHPSFENLRRVTESGRFGRIQHVFVCLNVPLRQLDAEDFKHWMFQHPKNIVLEQGTHPFSQLHALLGEVHRAEVMRGGRRELGPGLTFYDRWQIALECEKGPATVLLSFGKDFDENWMHVIGQDHSMRVDLLRRHQARWSKTPWMDFYDQWKMAWGNGFRGLGQGLRNSLHYVLSTLKVLDRTDVFYLGMKGSIEGFHRAFRDARPVPCPGEQGLAVVEYCEQSTAGVEESPAARPSEPVDAVRDGEILITGATGFLGGHLVERLRRDGHPLRLLVRRPDLVPDRLRGDNISMVAGDLSDEEAINRAVKGARAVYHLATGGGDTWEEVERSMIGGCRRIAEACTRHGVKQLFFTSTIATLYLGDGKDAEVTETTETDPRPDGRSLYARGKICCEQVLREFHGKDGLAVTVFRPGVVVGQRGPVQHSGVGLWTRDSQCFGWGGGGNPLPFVLVTDVADALARALERPAAAGKSYNLVGEAEVTAREYVDELAKRCHRDFQFHAQPLWWFQTIEVFKWLVKVVIRRPGVTFPSYRDLKTRALARRFDVSGCQRELDWKPVSDRGEFLEAALGWYVRAQTGPDPGATEPSGACPDPSDRVPEPTEAGRLS